MIANRERLKNRRASIAPAFGIVSRAIVASAADEWKPRISLSGHHLAAGTVGPVNPYLKDQFSFFVGKEQGSPPGKQVS